MGIRKKNLKDQIQTQNYSFLVKINLSTLSGFELRSPDPEADKILMCHKSSLLILNCEITIKFYFCTFANITKIHDKDNFKFKDGENWVKKKQSLSKSSSSFII